MQVPYPLALHRSEAQLRAEAVLLQQHPDFVEVWYDYTEQLSVYREVSRPFAKLIANEDRFRALNYFFTVWAEKVAHGGDGATTYSELYEICRRGEVSARILKTMLSLATFYGFVTRSRNPDDGRSWLYTPTQTMTEFPLNWIQPATRALDRLIPERSWTKRLLSDPSYPSAPVSQFWSGVCRWVAADDDPA